MWPRWSTKQRRWANKVDNHPNEVDVTMMVEASMVVKVTNVVGPVHFSYRHGRDGGGTQLFEGAHLTGGDMRFCHKSSKSRGFLGVKSSNSPFQSY